ncbi:MAG: hypothetical protein NZ895_05555 [Archaeoglobaceae archaeon]|nr:hypothetical protein [Archaeoglobaceae archaeon]MCX8151774.1 hypothetical protein [Archaeoglobaceae archaeon]MDW8013201.1 hypothetical protein [Archaeoglobaceae archaeon]
MPWPPKVFWVGLIIMYGSAVLGWTLEAVAKMNKIAPLPILYTSIYSTFLLPVIIATLYFFFPERAEAKRAREAAAREAKKAEEVKKEG